MPDFDILGNNIGGQGGGSSGFNIVAPNAGGPQVRPNGQVFLNGAQSGQLQAQQPQVQQPQGAPMSGLLAGVLGLPQYSGAAPGAVYTTPGQVPGQQGQTPVQQAGQSQNAGSALASALGMGARSLFDGVVGGGG